MKRFTHSLLILAMVGGLLALAGFKQMAPAGDKVAGYGTATNDVANVSLAAPGGGRHIVIYGVDATCETAAAFTLTLTEDAGGTPAVIGVFGGFSATNHHVEFPGGLIVSDNTTLDADASACGAAVDGHVTIWGQVEQ